MVFDTGLYPRHCHHGSRREIGIWAGSSCTVALCHIACLVLDWFNCDDHTLLALLGNKSTPETTCFGLYGDNRCASDYVYVPGGC